MYLLVFAVVWLPSLLARVHVLIAGPAHAPTFALSALEAICMPLQGEAIMAAASLTCSEQRVLCIAYWI